MLFLNYVVRIFFLFFFFNEVTTLIRFDNSTAGRVLYIFLRFLFWFTVFYHFCNPYFLFWFVMTNYKEVRNLRYLRSGIMYLFVYLSIIRGSHFRPILVSTEMWLASSLITLRSFTRKPEVSQTATTGRLLQANGVFPAGKSVSSALHVSYNCVFFLWQTF